MEHKTMIQVDNLTKAYGAIKAVNGITFDVPSGQVLGFIGPNGAGKTTTIKILTCYIAATSGAARVAGMDVGERSLEVRQLVGYLPEDTPLYHDMTTLEFLRFAAALRQVEAKQRTKRIQSIAEVCGLQEVMGQPVGELSKGYRQRVGLAQALIHDPPILIFDEPTSGLDPNQIVEIRELIVEIGKRKTVILSSHILPIVEATCGRVILIHRGELVADGTVGDLVRQHSGLRFQVWLAPGEHAWEQHVFREQVRQKLEGIKGANTVEELDGEPCAFAVATDEENQEAVLQAITACVTENGWVLLELQRPTANLEDVFRKLTAAS
jgi:ABC-2 type transport system ATP-binding protein